MRSFSIGSRTIGDGAPCFVTFECGSTYTSLTEAKELVCAVAESGADAIKFQLIDADRLLSDKKQTFKFTQGDVEKEVSLYETLKMRDLGLDGWAEVFQVCKSKNLEFFATVCFPEQIEFLRSHGGCALKIAAGDVNHYHLIGQAAASGLPVMLDGRARYHELEQGVRVCEEKGNSRIVLHHCPSGYPARNDRVNLRVVSALKQLYTYPVGFSDHSSESVMNFAALALGADMIEKTLTLDKKRPGVEHAMSLEPAQASRFVSELRAIEQAMGSARILFDSSVNESLRRCVFAKRDLGVGDKVALSDVEFQRPGTAGISAEHFEKVLGRSVKHPIAAGSALRWDDLDS
jgi:N,N'-diacetyllegionaminate synthase